MGAPSNPPPTRPSLARNSAMIWAFQSPVSVTARPSRLPLLLLPVTRQRCELFRVAFSANHRSSSYPHPQRTRPQLPRPDRRAIAAVAAPGARSNHSGGATSGHLRASLPTSPGWKDSWVHASRTSGRDVLSTKIELVFDYVGALNDEQRAAVTHQGGSLRVLAGAGTGKTTTLTTRVAWLLASGTPPERVLLLTFARRAARAMLTPTDALLRRSGTEAAGQRVVGGTFHAVAHRTLRRHADPLGLPDGFSVIDTSDAADVLDLVRDDHLGGKAPSRRFPRKTTLHDLYSRAVNTGRPISAVIGDTAPWATQDAEAVAAICKAYVARKRALGLLDFDDLLLYCEPRSATIASVRGSPRRSTTFWSTNTRTSTPFRSTSCARCGAATRG